MRLACRALVVQVAVIGNTSYADERKPRVGFNDTVRC